MESLNQSQRRLLQPKIDRFLFDQQEDINKQLQDFMSETPDAVREVTPYLRIRSVDISLSSPPPSSKSTSSANENCLFRLTDSFGGQEQKKVGDCILTIWRPTEENLETLTEGKRLKIFFVLPRTPKPKEGRFIFPYLGYPKKMLPNQQHYK